MRSILILADLLIFEVAVSSVINIPFNFIPPFFVYTEKTYKIDLHDLDLGRLNSINSLSI